MLLNPIANVDIKLNWNVVNTTYYYMYHVSCIIALRRLNWNIMQY